MWSEFDKAEDKGARQSWPQREAVTSPGPGGGSSREGAPNNSHDPEGLRLLPNWRGKKKREINAFPLSKSTWKPRELR